MNRREFLLKLGKSVLVITAVTATGRLLSKKEGDSVACADDTPCTGCASLRRCGLPKRNAYVNRNEYMKQNDNSRNGTSMNSVVDKHSTENS